MNRTRACAWWLVAALAFPGFPIAPPAAADGDPFSLRDDPLLAAGPGERTPFAEPAGELRLRDALSFALLRHPALAAHAWEVRAREAEVLQSGAWPNPGIGLEVENVGGTGPVSGLDGAETTLALSQLFLLGGKLDGRQRSAESGRDVAAWDYEITRVDVLAATTMAFVDVLAAQQHLALADTLVRVAEEMLDAVSRRVTAGGVSRVEETRARVVVEMTLVNRQRVLRRLAAIRVRLAGAWGSTEPAFERVVGELGRIGEIPELAELANRIDTSPELARWVAEADRRRADRDLSRATRIPDLEFAAGIRRYNESDDTAFVFGVGLPIPLFDRNKGGIRAAEIRISQADEQRRETRVRAGVELAAAYAELSAAAMEAVALRDRILPEAESAAEQARAAYRGGRFRLTDVLDTERTLAELRGRHIDALASYHISVAEIERLLGTPLHETQTSRGR